jgi:hypothetical protein
LCRSAGFADCVLGGLCLYSRAHSTVPCASRFLVLTSILYSTALAVVVSIVFSKAQHSSCRGSRLSTIFFGTATPYSRRCWIFVALSGLFHVSLGDTMSLSFLAFDNNYRLQPHNYTPYSIRCCTMARITILWNFSGPSISPRLPHSPGGTTERLSILVIFCFALQAKD